MLHLFVMFSVSSENISLYIEPRQSLVDRSPHCPFPACNPTLVVIVPFAGPYQIQPATVEIWILRQVGVEHLNIWLQISSHTVREANRLSASGAQMAFQERITRKGA